MIKTIWQKIKPILIIAGVMAVLIFGMLLYTKYHDRLPETPGVSLYLGWAEDTPGSYTPMTELVLKDSSYKSIYGPHLTNFQQAIGQRDIFIGMKLDPDGRQYISITW